MIWSTTKTRGASNLLLTPAISIKITPSTQGNGVAVLRRPIALVPLFVEESPVILQVSLNIKNYSIFLLWQILENHAITSIYINSCLENLGEVVVFVIIIIDLKIC